MTKNSKFRVPNRTIRGRGDNRNQYPRQPQRMATKTIEAAPSILDEKPKVEKDVKITEKTPANIAKTVKMPVSSPVKEKLEKPETKEVKAAKEIEPKKIVRKKTPAKTTTKKAPAKKDEEK